MQENVKAGLYLCTVIKPLYCFICDQGYDPAARIPLIKATQKNFSKDKEHLFEAKVS